MTSRRRSHRKGLSGNDVSPGRTRAKENGPPTEVDALPSEPSAGTSWRFLRSPRRSMQPCTLPRRICAHADQTTFGGRSISPDGKSLQARDYPPRRSPSPNSDHPSCDGESIHHPSCGGGSSSTPDSSYGYSSDGGGATRNDDDRIHHRVPKRPLAQMR
jgi:hypothetical protein